ncbi:MAG: IPT/TIG domain-containing protein [Myxococcota bacterium]
MLRPSRARPVWALLPFAALWLSACRDSPADRFDSGEVDPQDASVALPDAVVLTHFDGATTMVDPPTLDGVNPSSGPETGGTRVTVRGAHYVEPAQVFFGGVEATSVVVLDDSSIAATTPPGAVGLVDVKVVTAGGEATKTGGFRYHKDLQILKVTPERVPEEGGVLIHIDGKGFDEHTIVLIDRRPLAGLHVISAEALEGYAPASTPGRPEIYAFTAEAEDRRSDLLFVYATPELSALAPGYGPLSGGTLQAIGGDGFEGTERVEIGGTAASALSIRSRTEVDVNAPAVPAEGPYDVKVQNADTSAALVGGYVAFDPRKSNLEIVGVTPPAVSSRGGDVVTVVGHGFGSDAVIHIGGVLALSQVVRAPNAVLVVVPPGLPVGAADVTVDTRGLSFTKAGALRVFGPLDVTAISPDHGPASGGTAVSIHGSGFSAGTLSVRIGGVPVSDLVVVSDTEVTAKTVAGAAGPADVEVRNADTHATLPKGFFFEEAFEVVRLDPSEGSIAGGTLVNVLGRGFSGTASVTFGGVGGLVPTVENGSVITVRTKPAASGKVDVKVGVTNQTPVILEKAFQFYDPRLIGGGVWGGPINGTINVAVLDPQTRMGVPGIVVQLGYEADLRYAAITDQNGLATLSAPEIRGPQTITAGQTKFAFVTYMEVNARNVTMFTSAYPESPPPDAPVPPCPSGGAAPIIRGKVYKFKTALDPVTHPGWVAAAIITYSQASVFAPNPPMPAEQQDQVFMDGDSYEIVVMRGGTVAVYAILGDLDTNTQTFIPRRMGIVRNVPAAIGHATEGVNIPLDIELDRDTLLQLDNPPVQQPGPSLNAVFPYLNLGSDGVIAFNPSVVPDNTAILLSGLPNLTGAAFYYLAGSFTSQATGGIGAPYSLTISQSEDDPLSGINLGPFLRMPEDVSPKTGTLLQHGKLSWTQNGIQPDLVSINVSDQASVSGCCCVDANMNGACESTEAQMCGAAPVGFDRWSVFGPGGLMSYAMPPMPSGVHAYENASQNVWVTQQAIAPRFNYGEWVMNQYSPYFWKSWTVSFDQFLSKEETD